MKLNIELVRKKETANVIDFEYEIEESAKGEFLGLLSAGEIASVKYQVAYICYFSKYIITVSGSSYIITFIYIRC